MKKVLAIFAILILISCNDEDNATPTTPIDDFFDPMELQVTLLKQGALTGVGHTVSGTVKVYDDAGKKVVVLDPFSSQNGPDLKVYLAPIKTQRNTLILVRSNPRLANNRMM